MVLLISLSIDDQEAVSRIFTFHYGSTYIQISDRACPRQYKIYIPLWFYLHPFLYIASINNYSADALCRHQILSNNFSNIPYKSLKISTSLLFNTIFVDLPHFLHYKRSTKLKAIIIQV